MFSTLSMFKEATTRHSCHNKEANLLTACKVHVPPKQDDSY